MGRPGLREQAGPFSCEDGVHSSARLHAPAAVESRRRGGSIEPPLDTLQKNDPESR